jgi:hypothetical protein
MAWIAEESLPTASWALAAAVCQAPASESGEWVYAIGGIGDGNVLAAVAGYDTVQQRWFARPSMPTPRSGLAAATSPGRVHVLGGSSANADFLTTHEVYEPANDAWSKAAPLPSARGTLAAATGPDGLIYAIGGADANSVLATVEAYDPAADKWIAKAPLRTPRGWVAAVTGHDGLIYAIGGGSGSTILNSIEVFNVTTDTWTTSPYTLPLPTCGLAAAVDPNGLIFAIGGDNLVNNTTIPSPTYTATTQPRRVGQLSPRCRLRACAWPLPPAPTASSMRSAAPTPTIQVAVCRPPSRHTPPISATRSSTRSRWSKTTSALRPATWETFPHRLGRVPRRSSPR